MSSQTRNPREDANRLDLRTLAIASVSAAVAAIVVSRIWASGTPIAAAATPVVVTILKEMLDRPTAKMAEKVTVSTRALPDTEVREPAASHVGRDSQLPEGPTRHLPPTEAMYPEADGDLADIRVYRQPPSRGVAGRIKPKVVALTAALAFLIAGVVLTAGQLAIGNPFGDDGNGAIILGGGKNSKRSQESQQQNTTTEPQQTTPSEEQQQTTPEAAPDQQQTAPAETGGQQAPQQRSAPPQQTTPQAPAQPAPGPTQP